MVVEASWGPPKQDLCLPGAIHLDTDRLEDGWPTWRLRPVPELQAEFGALGLCASDPIVVTGSSAIAAARVAAALWQCGAGHTKVLDCGKEAWIQGGMPTAREFSVRPPVEFGGVEQPGILASLADLEAAYEAGTSWIADVRSEAEHRGETSGYASLTARGRIPGSIHAGDADDRAGLYVDAEGRLASPDAVVDLWRASGLALNKERTGFERDTIFVCGGGWRASLALVFARHLGLRNARACEEGWAGWSTDFTPDPNALGPTPGFRQSPSGRPVEIGPLRRG